MSHKELTRRNPWRQRQCRESNCARKAYAYLGVGNQVTFSKSYVSSWAALLPVGLVIPIPSILDKYRGTVKYQAKRNKNNETGAPNVLMAVVFGIDPRLATSTYIPFTVSRSRTRKRMSLYGHIIPEVLMEMSAALCTTAA